MNSYLKKQSIIALIYLIIFASIGGGIYRFFIYSPAGCFDGKLNQNEEKIDCGGICAACQEELVNPNILWIKVLPVEGGLYDLAAQIENKNINYGSGMMPYAFKVYDSSGGKIGELKSRSYIMPREKKYLVDTISLSAAPAKVSLEFGSIEWKKFKLVESLNLPVFNQIIDLNGKNSYAAFAQGTVYNKTRFDLDTIDIDIIVYDSIGNVIAVNKTQKNTMKSGEGRFFEVVWPKSFAADYAKVKMEQQAYTNVFSDANFIATFLK